MSNQTLKIPSWLLNLLIGVGAIGILLVFIPSILDSGRSHSNPLTEYGDTISFIGDLLYTIAEISLFSMVAVKLTGLKVSKPSPIIFWIYVGCSLISLLWEDFGWVFLVVALVVAVLCFGNKDTKNIGIWMIVTLIVTFIYAIFIEDHSISGKGMMKVVMIILCLPPIYMFEACKKFILAEETLEDLGNSDRQESSRPTEINRLRGKDVDMGAEQGGAEECEKASTSFFNAYFVTPYLRRYADFRGYTSRKSFWMTYLATVILGIGLSGLMLLLSSFGMGGLMAGSIMSGLIGLALIVPGLALSVRRLRDAGKNPWLILLGLIPVVGTIILLVFFCMESQYENTEEEGHWQMPDWIVTGVCVVALVLGIIFSVKSLTENLGGSYDLGDVDDYDCVEVEEDDTLVEEYIGVSDYDDNYSGSHSNIPSLADLSPLLDPQYFTNELKVYRMGSDRKMNQMELETGSTNISIKASGMISNHNMTLEGWITEDGTIHGRYHNENGINLDFNGYIKPDNSLYIQLGHDSEKSDWYLYPVVSELPEGYSRYEGKWGKSQKDSYVVFSEY